MAANRILTARAKQAHLAARLVVFSIANLFVVSCLGVLLRAFPFLHLPLDYKNVLHGHSHFAFGGWIMPMLLALILKLFPEVTARVAYRHWRNIAVLFLASAYGMLFAFSMQGYKAVSIFFSTVSVGAGYYLIVVLWRALNGMEATTSTRFLKAGLFYLGVSAIGPFATGPLIAFGWQGTSLYFDAIYFYLHFQYNGWFLFAVLAFLYKMLEQAGRVQHGSVVFKLFNLACIPAYALSVLWHQPHHLFNVVGGAAALLQAIGVFYLLKDVPLLQWKRSAPLYALATAALVLKTALQVASDLPLIATLGYTYRNFILAYLHLVLLGCISVFLLAFFCSLYPKAATPLFKTGCTLFLFAFLTTEILLVVQASGSLLGLALPRAALWLLAFSCFFPAGTLAMTLGVLKSVAAKKSTASWRTDVAVAG